MVEFGDLQLQLDTDTQDIQQIDSWAVSEDGSLLHNKTGISIGELGLRDGKNLFAVEPADIEVDQTNLLGRGLEASLQLAGTNPRKPLLL